MTPRQLRDRSVARWLPRLIAILMAAGFLGTGAIDAYGLHRCPHHDGLPGGEPAAATHAHGEESHDAGAGGHGEHGPCTCVGACGITAAALPVPVPATLGQGDRSDRNSPVYPAASHTPLRLAYFLPFANAPPSMR